ncbi:hypothetical protein HQ399_17515 [Aeromonas jandaei]|uniref:Flagellar biosynthesis protein FlhB n=1 Tax=Aeromonas jandaei TaxID=650 RepID=A0ABD7ES52_AERJA|nr:hypothetical protein [Aeromonas jandaei]QWL63923.1 hypothetical protein HQ399_17515 [Aeromonas jandaei]
MNELPPRVGLDVRSVQHEKQTIEPQRAQDAQQNQKQQERTDPGLALYDDMSRQIGLAVVGFLL